MAPLIGERSKGWSMPWNNDDGMSPMGSHFVSGGSIASENFHPVTSGMRNAPSFEPRKTFAGSPTKRGTPQ